MSFTDDFFAELNKKKKKEEEQTTVRGSNKYTTEFMNALGNSDIAPVYTLNAPLLTAPRSHGGTSGSFIDTSFESNKKLTSKWGKYLKAKDYSEYSTASGSKMKDVGWKFWQDNGDEKYDFINNINDYRKTTEVMTTAAGQSNQQDKYGDFTKYSYLSDKEIGLYNYIYAKEGKDKAEEFLADLEDTLGKRYGQNIYDEATGVGKSLYWFPGGLTRWGEDVKQFFSSEELPTNPALYASEQIEKEAFDKNILAGLLYKGGEGFSNQIPNIILTKGASTIAEGFGIAANIATKIGKYVGEAGMFFSSAGGAYGAALEEGRTEEEARTYSTIIGALETKLQSAIGGISAFGGISESGLMNKVALIENTALRLTAKYGLQLGAEIGEEELQLWLDPLVKTIVYGDEYDTPEIEEMLETAFVTAISTGLLNASSNIQDGTKVNGYTVNDAKYVESEIEKRIKEQEEKGEKLTKREKEKIREDVTEMLETGQLDIDDIDSVYGSETEEYKAYKEWVETEDRLKPELEKLRQMKAGDMNYYQSTRLNQLNGMNLDDKTKRITLRENLNKKMLEILGEDSKLAEVYRDEARSRQRFTVDLSQYRGRRRAAVERAMNSGILNNTFLAHTMVDSISALEERSGITFDFANNKKLQEMGLYVEGKAVNGVANKAKKRIIINTRAGKMWRYAVGHEIGHILETTGDFYNSLQKELYAYAESKGELETKRQEIIDTYEGMDADIESELTADLLGEYLFSDSKFIDRLTGNRPLFEKIYEEVKYLCKVATGRQLTEIEKVKQEFDRAWKQLKPDVLTQEEKNAINGINEEAQDAEIDDYQHSISVTDEKTLNDLNEQVARGEYNAETNPDGGYYVTYKSMSFWGYDDEGNAILRSPMAEYVDGELSNAYLIPKDKSKLNWYQATETLDEATGLPSGLMVKVKKPGNKSFTYLPAAENQDLIAEDWSNLYFNLQKKVLKDGKWVKSDVPARYNPYEHSSNSMLNDQFSAAYLRDNLVTVKMYVPVSEDNGAFRAKWSKDPTGWADWKTGTVAGKINKQKDLQRRVYLSRYAAPVEIVPDSEVAQAYKEYLDGTDVTIPDNVVSPNLLKELKNAGVPITESGKVQYSLGEIVDENNNSYGIGVHLDSTLLDDLSTEERINKVKEHIKGLGGDSFTAFDNNGNPTDITIAKPEWKFKNKKNKNIPVNKDLTTKFIKNETKQEALVLVDELIVSAKYGESKPSAYPHGWVDNQGKNDWEYWTTYIQDKNNTIWEATLNIANTANGEKILYDISPIKKVGRSVKSDTLPTGGSIAPFKGDVNTQFSLSKNVEETKDLIAVHNMQTSELEKSLALGGLPMPSIAIIKAQSGHSEYGDVSLVFSKDTIDPKKNKANKVYGGDAWTPVYPTIEYKANRKNADAISKLYYDFARQYGYDEAKPLYNAAQDLEDELNRYKGEAGLIEAYKDDTRLMNMYLQQSGKGKVEPIETEIRTEMSDAQVEMNEHFIRELGADVVADVMTPSGESPATHRKQYWAEHGEEVKEAYGKYLSQELGIDAEGIENVLSNTNTFQLMKLVRDAYAYSKNGRVTTKTEIDKAATDEAIREKAKDGYNDWLDSLFKGSEEKSGIRNNVDYFTPMGNRRSFEALHWENNLENVVRVMKSQDETGGGALISGFGIFGVSAKDYKSIDDIKADESRLTHIPEEEYKEIRKGFSTRLNEICESIMSKTESNPFIALDNACECVVEALRTSKTKSGILNSLKQYPQLNVTETAVDDIISLVSDIANMPTEYFEAKPRRAVGFDEVASAVIPDNASAELKQNLTDKGIRFIEYESGNEESRLKALNLLEEYKFSISPKNESSNSLYTYGTAAYEPADIAPVADTVDLFNPDGLEAQIYRAEETLQGIMNEVTELDRNGLKQYTDDELREKYTELGERAKIASAEYERLKAELDQYNRERSESLIDEDVPPEMDAPYTGKTNKPTKPHTPFDDLSEHKVTGRKAVMVDHPEFAPYIQKGAADVQSDLADKLPGERIVKYDSTGKSDTGYNVIAQKRLVAPDIGKLKDVYGYTWDELDNGIQEVIDGNVKSAIAKRLEMLIHKRLSEGYTDTYGRPVVADAKYLEFLRDREADNFRSESEADLMQNADMYAPMLEDIAPLPDEQLEQGTHENIRPKPEEATAKSQKEKSTRKALYERIINGLKNAFSNKGFNLDEVLKKAKNLSTFASVDNTPQRVMQKALGYEEGDLLADLTVNKVAQNETESIKWLNTYTDRKTGLLAQLTKQYHIKPGSKESAAAMMYAEGFYVDEDSNIIKYGDAELAQDFPDITTQNRIKGFASDPRIRQVYDETLGLINESRARNAYPEIPRLENYYLHFRAMEDTFSRLGLPFNPNDIRAKDLPTDLNGVTADLKPGQPYFASAMHRRGLRTTYDLLGGLERYLTSAKNQIFHIDDIQTLRALRNYIADTYGQAKGLEDIDNLTEEEAQERIEQVYGSHLSTFAKFLNEEANVLAGKTALIDRGLEGILGRRGMTFLDTVNRQVGSNLVGFSASSAVVNFDALPRALAKSNKFDFLKAFTQTVTNRIGSVFGKNDGFAENSPVIIRRKGAERFYRTPFQKVGDAGYFLMGVVDDISTEIIARTKYNELTRKGMSEQQAHFETDKWVSRLMGDRSLGQMPQIFNSKTLGLITKFQLEVRNNLDSQFYDTIQDAKVSNKDIENRLLRNAKTAAKITSTLVQLAVAQHIFGKAFESVAGYNPSFDIISVLMTMFGADDDEESEDTVLDNIEQAFLELVEDLPYASTFTGGRIPISNALPIGELVTGKDSYGNEKSRLKTLGEIAPYYILPGGYGQIKKTYQGLNMFNITEEHPVAGSYTKSDKLRFPVADTPKNRVQAALFGQYANENARAYFDKGYDALNKKQIEEYMDVDLPIADYWKYREGLKGLKTNEEKADYINSLDIENWQKNLLMNNILDRKEDVDMSNYNDYGSYEEFDYAQKNPEKYEFFKENGISYSDYANADEEGKDAYNWAYNNPDKVAFAKAVAGDVVAYRGYATELYNIKADKDEYGKSINGSRKEKVLDYINNLNADYETKIILWKSEYPSDDTYNVEIIEYLNNREDLTYEDRVSILTELGFKVSNGEVYWD